MSLSSKMEALFARLGWIDIMIYYLVFDVETRVDKELVKQIYDPEDCLTLDQAYDTARDKLLERSGQQSDFFPVPYHIPLRFRPCRRMKTIGSGR